MKKILRTLPFLAGAFLVVSICAGATQAQPLCSSCSLILLNYQCPGVPLSDQIACSNLPPEEQAACNQAAQERANNACLAAQNEAWATCVQTCVNVYESPAPTPMPMPTPPSGGGDWGIEIPTDCPEMEFFLAAAIIFAVGPRFKKRKK